MHSLPEDRTLFEAIPDPAFRLDRYGTILDLNAAARAEPAPGGGNPIGQSIHGTRLKAIAGDLAEALEQVIARRKTAGNTTMRFASPRCRPKKYWFSSATSRSAS